MGNTTHEAFSSLSVTSDPTDNSLDLGRGTIGQHVHSVLMNFQPAGGSSISDYKIQFYDGDPTGSGQKLSEKMWIIVQPENGFIINKSLETGTLYYRITGHSTGTLTVKANVYYNWDKH